MKIQIYKGCFDTKIESEDNTFTFVNPEVKNLYLLLKQGGHEVELLSPCDINQTHIKESTHKILVNSRFYSKGDELDSRCQKELQEVKEIFNNSIPQLQCITDPKIVEKNGSLLAGIHFTNITQSPLMPEYAEYEKIFLYNNMPTFNNNRNSKIIYIGNERSGKRKDGIDNFLINSGVDFDLFGGIQGSKGKIKYKDSQNLISNYTAGLCITEDLYQRIGHRTPRLFEYLLAGTIPFCESNFPRDLNIIDNEDFRVVHDGVELKDKLNFLNRFSSFRTRLQLKGYQALKSEYFTGEYQLKILENILDG